MCYAHHFDKQEHIDNYCDAKKKTHFAYIAQQDN